MRYQFWPSTMSMSKVKEHFWKWNFEGAGQGEVAGGTILVNNQPQILYLLEYYGDKVTVDIPSEGIQRKLWMLICRSCMKDEAWPADKPANQPFDTMANFVRLTSIQQRCQNPSKVHIVTNWIAIPVDSALCKTWLCSCKTLISNCRKTIEKRYYALVRGVVSLKQRGHYCTNWGESLTSIITRYCDKKDWQVTHTLRLWSSLAISIW